MVTTWVNGWNVRLTDEQYFKLIEQGKVKAPDFVFLFDTTGYAAEPFTEAGYTTLIVDLLNVGGYALNKRAHTVADWNIIEFEQRIVELVKIRTQFVFGFPPCDDLAGSGALHWDTKHDANPNFQKEAVQLFASVERIGKAANIPYAAENPKGAASTLYRKPDFMFAPFEYGGYLPEQDAHPEYPKYIAPRDAYPKETFLWCGNGFELPVKRAVVPEPGYSRQYRLLGGKSAKTKRIRSASPRGFFKALFELYCLKDFAKVA